MPSIPITRSLCFANSRINKNCYATKLAFGSEASVSQLVNMESSFYIFCMSDGESWSSSCECGMRGTQGDGKRIRACRHTIVLPLSPCTHSKNTSYFKTCWRFKELMLDAIMETQLIKTEEALTNWKQMKWRKKKQLEETFIISNGENYIIRKTRIFIHDQRNTISKVILTADF